jgi:uncharacterized protein with HEPN domain
MSDRDRGILLKIEKYILDAGNYTAEMDYDSFSNDSKTISATAFVLGQVGELAKEISPDMTAAHPGIPWKGMRGMRNRIVHDYENVDLKILWETIRDDLPALLSQIRALLDER